MSIPELRKLGLDQFIADVIIGSSADNQRLCFILGSGASVSSGIPTGGELEMDWMDYIMKQSEQYIEEVRRISEELYRTKDIDHSFTEIEQAWKTAVASRKEVLPSKYYFDLFVLRFYGKTKNWGGIRELQRRMRGSEPSIGYYILSLLLTGNNNQNNVVITTNFDSLVEKAVFAFTEQAPVSISHESLLDSMMWNAPYPIIAKVHRDVMFSPLNSTKEVSKLKDQWKEPLQNILERYAPIVIGYAGADKSLMAFLEDEETKFPNGLYWCYREKSDTPDKRIVDFVINKKGYFVPIENFDELMVRIAKYNRSGDDPTDISILEDLQTRYTANINKFTDDLQSITIKMESVTPSSSWGFFNRAYRYYEDKDYIKAIKDYSKAIELNPDYAGAYNNRGVVYSKLGEYSEAISDYNKAIELNPDYALAYNNRGNAYSNLGDYSKAMADYNKAIELNPDDALAYNNRGNVYKNLGDYSKAMADCNKAIELNPDYAEAYNNRGNVYSNLGDYSKVMADYNKAIELNPDYAEVYNNRGNAYSNLGDYSKAMADYNKAIELNPDDALAYNNRGNAYSNLGDYSKAMVDYNKAIELNPDDALAYNNRGNVYCDLGEYSKAISDYNKAIELNPDYALAFHNRGIAYANLEEHSKAISDYNKAMELDPTLMQSES